MTREEAKTWLIKLYARSDITDEYGDMEDMQPYEEAVNMAIKALEQEPNIKSLGEDLRICRESITDEKVLIGFNMAVALCNKHFGGK